MARGRELIKNTGILLISKISTQIVSFLLLPLYTALLTTAEYGEIDIYTSLTMLVIPFLTMQLEMGLFRFFITEKKTEQRCRIITTSFVIIGRILVASTIIYWCAALLFKFKYSSYIYFYYLSMTISTVLLQVCRAYGNNKAYGIASFISSALAVGLNVLFIAGLHWKVEGILLSSTIAQAVSSVYMLLKTNVFSYYKRKEYNKDTAQKLLRYSVPLVFNQISSWAINYSDRLIILTAWGTSANGIYSLANKFSNITNTFFNVFNVAWTENVVRSLDDKDHQIYINHMFRIIYNAYMALITGIVNLLPFFYSILVNDSYNDAYGHVPILLLAMFFSGMAATIGSVYIANNRTKEVSITTIMAGVCNIIVHLSLLRVCGLYAASISTLVSFALLFLYRYIFVNKFFKLTIKVREMLPQIFIFAVAWVVYLSRNNIFVTLGLALNLIYILRIISKNKKMLLSIIKRK